MTTGTENPHLHDHELASRLAERTLALVDIPSVSREEAAVIDYVRAAIGLEHVWDDGDVVFALTPRRAGHDLVVLAGHVDTIPAQGNLPGRIDADEVVGLGASDMKSGVAVILELADWARSAQLELDLGFLLFTREEIDVEASPLPAFFADCPMIHEAALVVVMEPTDNEIHAGCVGNLNARLTFRGRSAHSARPWTGENAIHKAAAAVAPLAKLEPLDVEIDGLVFREVVSAVGIEGGIADNVVPERCSVRLNYRYAPGRSREQAEERIRSLAAGAEVEIVGNAPSAPVVVERPLVQRLREVGAFDVQPKQAWTPVAQFAEVGLDAINLGPGATRYAHTVDERVSIAALVRSYDALRRFAADTV
jgi:succinyl-diaminopimelate desuccinylase